MYMKLVIPIKNPQSEEKCDWSLISYGPNIEKTNDSFEEGDDFCEFIICLS